MKIHYNPDHPDFKYPCQMEPETERDIYIYIYVCVCVCAIPLPFRYRWLSAVLFENILEQNTAENI